MKCLIFSYEVERLAQEAAFYNTVTAEVPLISPNRIVYYLMCLQALLEIGNKIVFRILRLYVQDLEIQVSNVFPKGCAWNQ